MNTHYMQSLDWLILGAYFAILLAIGIWASTKRKKEGSLFLAERSLRWHHIGFSMWGTNVGPSMLIASASAGFTTGIVSGNYAWYAFVFIGMLAFVFAPRYLGSHVQTLPEFMGLRFGQSTRNILAWYTIVTIIISLLALTLFAGGILIRQVFDIPMWMSALVLLVISAFFTMLGGLKAVAYTNVYQMSLLIIVSAVLTIVGINHVGGISALVDKVPSDYWILFKPNSDEAFPWLPTGRIEGNITRDPKDRTRMTVADPMSGVGKPAVTHYRVVERLGYVTLVECRLETGRTHQIRAHMKHIGHPLFGDERYGGTEILRGERSSTYKAFINNCFKICPRQALHAKTLGFVHPVTGEQMDFDSPMPADLAALLDKWHVKMKGDEYKLTDIS